MSFLSFFHRSRNQRAAETLVRSEVFSYPKNVPLRQMSAMDALGLKDEEKPVAQTVPAQSAFLLRLSDGRVVSIGTGLIIGRAVEPNGQSTVPIVSFNDPERTISRIHAQLGISPDGSLWIEDRGSSNGTFVQRAGQRFQLQPGQRVALAVGDLLLFGNYSAVVEVQGSPAQ